MLFCTVVVVDVLWRVVLVIWILDDDTNVDVGTNVDDDYDVTDDSDDGIIVDDDDDEGTESDDGTNDDTAERLLSRVVQT